MNASMTLPYNAEAAEMDRWPVHDIALSGYWSVDGGEDTPCVAVKISMTTLTLRAHNPPHFLDRVVLALPHIGLLETTVAETSPEGFLVRFPPSPTSKLGTYVGWLEGATRAGSHDMRRHDRLVPMKRLITLIRSGETPSLARIVDLSRSGVAFTTSKQLNVGEPVRLGAHAGFIVRIFDGGGAAHFNELLDEAGFGAMIDLDRVAPVGADVMRSH